MKRSISIIVLTFLIAGVLVGAVSAKKPEYLDNTEKMQDAISINNPLIEEIELHEKIIDAGKSGLTVAVDPLEVFAD